MPILWGICRPTEKYEKERGKCHERLAFSFFCEWPAAARARAAFSPSSVPPVCVRKPNSLALRAVVRKPHQSPSRLFSFFRPVGLRTKTKFIDFAGSRTQTLPGPGPLFLLLPALLIRSLVDRNRREGLSYIFRKMCRLGFQKIFCSYSNFSGLRSRNSSEGLFNDFSETFQIRATF